MTRAIEALLEVASVEFSRGRRLRALSRALRAQSVSLRGAVRCMRATLWRLPHLCGGSDVDLTPARYGGTRGQRVAVFSIDESSVRLRGALAEAGFTTSGSYVQEILQERFDLQEFLERLRPDAAVCEAREPFEAALTVLRLVRRFAAPRAVPFVFVTPDPAPLLLFLDGHGGIDEMVIGEPYDVGVLVRVLDLVLRDQAA